MGDFHPLIRIQSEDFDIGDTVARLRHGHSNIGAIVSFTGICRDEGGVLAALELEHYPGMAEEELMRVALEAARRWPLQAIVMLHRYGKIPVGGNIVLVATASAHRLAAFESAEFLMDYLKTRAPFWKKEHRNDGSVGEWVAAQDADDAAAERWNNLP